jgi:hypothetical protein
VSPAAHVQAVLDKLPGYRPEGAGWVVCCPAHDDSRPSLRIDVESDGTILLVCRSAGCKAKDIMTAVGLTERELFPPRSGSWEERIKSVYVYRDKNGKPMFEVCRLEPGLEPGEKKTFRQRAPDGSWKTRGIKRGLYRYPELLAADPTQYVFFCEGEKAANAVAALGLVATCTSMGACKAKHTDPDALKNGLQGRHVILLADNDEPGEKHVQDVRNRILPFTASATILRLPGLGGKEDVFDWIQRGGTRDELLALAGKVELNAEEHNIESKAETATTAAGFEFEKLSGIAVRAVRWKVPGRVPRGKVILIAADGGVGKSTLVRHFVARASTGTPAFGLTYDAGAPCSILMLAAEDSFEEVVVPSLVAEGADLDRVHRVFHLQSEPNGKTSRVHIGPEHIEELKEELLKRPDVEIVVIDPVASFVSRARIDDHKQAELRQVLDPLAELAEATGVTIILIAHLNKGVNEHAVYRIAGSAAYANAVRLAYLVATDPDDEDRRLLMPVKMNLLGVDKRAAAFRLAPLSPTETDRCRRHPSLAGLADLDFAEVQKQLARVEFDAAVDVRADDVMAAKRKKSDPNKVQKCKAFLTTLLDRYAYPSQEILAAAAAEGFTFDNVKEAKAQLKSEGLRNSNRNTQGGEWWSGFGDQKDWIMRPKAASSSPLPTTPNTPQSPHNTNHTQRGEREEREVCGESGECGEDGTRGAAA